MDKCAACQSQGGYFPTRLIFTFVSLQTATLEVLKQSYKYLAHGSLGEKKKKNQANQMGY